ncbi:MAG TPA: recombinase family protein [Ktedonobacteraceae bacterium]
MATIVDIYTRVSTDPQDDNTSHEEQERSGRQYCAAHGLTVGIVHRETFSGFVYRERKKLSLMRERYREGKIQGVIVRTFDRLSRRQAHAAILLEEMDYHHVQFHCVMEPVNTEDKAMEQFVRMILAFVAEMEREKIMDRTMSGRVAKAQKGEIREGPKPLYGYQWHDPATKDYREIMEPQAAVCRWLHEQFDKGIGPRALLRAVVEKDAARKWTRGAIHQILSDPRRTGEDAQAFTRHQNGAKKPFEAVDLPDGTYPMIIDPELFARNQARLKINRAEATRQSKEPERFLLRAGYIKCEICKLTMHVNASRSRNAPIYFCSDGGHSNTVNTGTIDTLVWGYMVQLADEIAIIERAIQLATNNSASLREIAAILNSIVTSEAKIAQYTEDLANPALKGTARDVILGLLSDESAKLLVKQEEKSLVEAGIVDTDRLAAEAEKILVWCRTVKEARRELSYQEKRDFLRILGIRVFIGKSDKRSEDLIWRIEASLPEVQELIMNNTYRRATADSVTHISTCYP